MLRVAFYFVVLAAISVAAAWLVERPGAVVVRWQGFQIETSVAVLLVAVAAVAVVAAVLYRLWGWLKSRPRKIREARAAERRRRGYRAVTEGLVAVAAGDTGSARRAARNAEGLLGEPQLALLLAAQAAQLDGDDAGAERHFRRMLEHRDTEFLGLRGLIVQAEKRGDRAAALALAQRAFKLRPDTPWVQRHLLELQAGTGDWPGAMRTIEAAVKTGRLDRAEADRHRALYLYQQALAAEEGGNRRQALAHARDAHDRRPEFVPATALAARLLAAEGKRRPAARMIEHSWAAAAHPSLAALYADIEGNSTALARVKRLEALLNIAPEAAASQIALAEAALDAELWGKARHHLTAAAELAPTARVYRLLARLEEEEHGDGAAARRWLLKASAAVPDPAWVCDRCGGAHAAWTIHCPDCGAFDSLAWRSPASVPLALEGPEEQEAPPPPAPPGLPAETKMAG